MLMLRDAQLVALASPPADTLEPWLVAHARRCLPRQCAGLDDDALLELGRRARREAAAQGLLSPRGACTWLDLSLVLGPGFVDDPALPWVRPLLRDTARLDEAQRLDCLVQAARTWLMASPLEPDAAAAEAPPRIGGRP